MQPPISADPLFKSGSGDHLYPASSEFDNLNFGKSSYDFKRNIGVWPYVPENLMADLVDGRQELDDRGLQNDLISWMGSADYNVFRNKETKEEIHAMVCRRGNKVYATRKTKQKNDILNALKGKEFDFPARGSHVYRKTRMLFITVNFDREQFTKEEAWYALRSTPIEGCKERCGVINNLNSNLTKIFGKHGKFTCKEAQESGYPAPHMILVLDEPVLVKRHVGKNGESWRIADPIILKRIGKDSVLRKLTFNDHRKAMRMNPIWKYGFIDFEGIVKGARFKHKKDAFSYPFKYLSKCLTEENSESISQFDCINEISDKGLKTTMFTHLGNKCFRTRDITLGAGFKKRIGLLPKIASEAKSKWERIRTIPDFIHEYWVKEHDAVLLKKLLIGSTPIED